MTHSASDMPTPTVGGSDAGGRSHGRASSAPKLPVGGSHPWGRRTRAVAAFAAVLIADLVSKEWAASALAGPIRIADWLYLTVERNAGLLLGTVPVGPWYWVGMCTALGWFGWRAASARSTPVAVCLAVVLAGAAGNVTGLAQGAVVDFIGVGPIWGEMWLFANIADIALVAGGLALGCVLMSRRLRRTRVAT